MRSHEAKQERMPHHFGGRGKSLYDIWLKNLGADSIYNRANRRQVDTDDSEINLGVILEGLHTDIEVVHRQLILEAQAQRPTWDMFAKLVEGLSREKIQAMSLEERKKLAWAYNGLVYVWNSTLDWLLTPQISHQVTASERSYPHVQRAELSWLFEELVTSLNDLRLLMKYIEDNKLLPLLQR